MLFSRDCLFVYFMVFNATFNKISVISWRLVLLVGTKPEDPEKTIDLSHITDKLHHIIVYTSLWSRFELTTSVVICTDCIGSCISNYHTITATTVPSRNWDASYKISVDSQLINTSIKYRNYIANKKNTFDDVILNELSVRISVILAKIRFVFFHLRPFICFYIGHSFYETKLK